MKKKLTMIGAAFVLVIGMAGLLSACGGGGSDAQITDAASLAAANQAAQEKAENYHMDMDMDMDMTIKMEGLQEALGTDSMNVPMKMTMSMDAGKEAAHANSNTSMSMMGQSMEQPAEMYIDIANGVTYTKAEGTEQWTKTETDSSMSEMMNSVTEMSADILEKAKFAETEEGYTLTLDAGDLGEAIKEMNLFNSYSAAGMDMEEFNISEGQITYTFYKDTALIKQIDMQGLNIKAKGEMQGAAIDMQIKLTDTMDYSQYGEIDPKAYAIPAEVTGAE